MAKWCSLTDGHLLVSSCRHTGREKSTFFIYFSRITNTWSCFSQELALLYEKRIKIFLFLDYFSRLKLTRGPPQLSSNCVSIKLDFFSISFQYSDIEGFIIGAIYKLYNLYPTATDIMIKIQCSLIISSFIALKNSIYSFGKLAQL